MTQMERKEMTISEHWRWRFLLMWVIVFTFLSSYVLVKVHEVSDQNRDALCAIHRSHVTDEKSLKLLMEKDGIDVGEITLSIESEKDALSKFGCDN